MSKTWYGHHIETIKGDDYVLFKDYLKLDKEIDRLNNIINELENRDNVLEDFEKWLENQRYRNNEWDNFAFDVSNNRMGIPIWYLKDKIQELKEEYKENNK